VRPAPDFRRDLRAYARRTQAGLALGALALLLLVGDGLVWIIYGREAAGLAVLCTLLGLSPLALIWLGLAGMGWLANRIDRDEG
jgi:hypothetical protein